jgi:rubrerythrin
MNALEFALNLELEGARFYREQFERFHADGLKTVFLALALEETGHAEIIRNKSAGLPYTLRGGMKLPEAEDLFAGAAEPESLVMGLPDQAEVYKAALKIEQDSIRLYEGMLANAADDAGKDLYQFLISQEKEHEKILDGLFTHILRPKEWVESAEFGLRDEY